MVEVENASYIFPTAFVIQTSEMKRIYQLSGAAIYRVNISQRIDRLQAVRAFTK